VEPEETGVTRQRQLSKGRIASSFRVALFTTSCYLLGLFVDTVDQAVCFTGASVNFYRTTRRHIPENSTLHIQRSENVKSNRLVNFPYFEKKK
jgi:hypothetical protein